MIFTTGLGKSLKTDVKFNAPKALEDVTALARTYSDRVASTVVQQLLQTLCCDPCGQTSTTPKPGSIR
jgi:hypothetical protein